MKRKILVALLSISSLFFYAQNSIRGLVLDEQGEPLFGASVYLNNTTVGTVTDEYGAFLLFLKPGKHQLVVSFMGYNSAKFDIDTNDIPKSIKFRLSKKQVALKEIVIKNKKLNTRKKILYLNIFKEQFIGETRLSKKTRIVNEHDLIFDFDPATNTLDVSSYEPLVLVNNGLGYKITSDLIHFKFNFNEVHYLAFNKFEELPAKPKKKERWIEERQKAYFGSFRHFIKEITTNDNLINYEVDQVRFFPNPDRPTNREFFVADSILKRNTGLQKSPYKITIELEDLINKARETLQKQNLPKLVEVVTKSKIPKWAFLKDTLGVTMLESKHPLRVRYLREQPETNYSKIYTGEGFQTSIITLYEKEAKIHKELGILVNPLDVKFDKYWAYEKKMANQLPLDYIPSVK